MNTQNGEQAHNQRTKPPLMNGLAGFDVTHHSEARLSLVHMVGSGIIRLASVTHYLAGVTHYIEPLGTEPVMNLDFFLPAREDYRHLVKYLEEEK